MDQPTVIIGLSLLGALVLLFIAGSLASLVSTPRPGPDDDRYKRGAL
jgi:hypothetical protein